MIKNRHKRLILFFTLLLLAALIVILLLYLKAGMSISVPEDSESRPLETNGPNIERVSYTKKYLIGYSQCNFSEPWRAQANEQIKAAVSKHPEFDLIIKDGMQDNNKQISDIKSLIQKRCDLILISPNEALPLKDEIEEAYKSGIPVILLDRRIDGECYTQYIGADNYAIGKKAGEWVVRYLGEEGGNVAEILGSIGTSAQIERHNGFQDAISRYPNVKVISSGSSDWLMEKSIALMEKMLEDNAEIDVVFAHNDPSAEGAYAAAKRVNREKEIKFIGIDALADEGGGISSVINGRISVTYLYPSGAAEAIESAYKLLVKKEKLVKHLEIETLEITRDNAREVLDRLRTGKD